MSNDHSRKQFLAKLLGVAAVAAVVARAGAKAASVSPVAAAAGGPIQVRSDARSVARRDSAA